MVPWAGRGVDPSLADATYMDITGRLAVGRVFFIGTLETWMEHELINDALLPGYLSLEERRFKGLQDRQPSCLRVTSNGRPHTSLPYLLY